MAVPLVTVIVPARNEVDDIGPCLEAIAAQDHPVNRLEVIVVDGCSTDGTADAARRALGRWGFGSTAVISNPGGTASSNLNVGLAKASGEIVCRVDARTRIEPHYVRTCVEILTGRPEVAVVGGAQVAVERDPRARSIGIARALNNRWSMGGSRYRRGGPSGEADTVYLGAFRRLDLLDEAGWDEALVSNQDFDLNRRMARRGIVWFEASLRSRYLPRDELRLLWRQYRRFGRAKVRYWRHAAVRPQPRQWALMVGPPAVMAAGGLLLLVVPARARTALAGLAVVGAFGVEAGGAGGPPGGLAARGVGVVAMAVTAGGWWVGVAQEIIAPSTEPLGSDLRGVAS